MGQIQEEGFCTPAEPEDSVFRRKDPKNLRVKNNTQILRSLKRRQFGFVKVDTDAKVPTSTKFQI